LNWSLVLSSTFADLGVPSDLSALLAQRGITSPFPIQAATLPDALAGRDVCGKAPTGSGKTLAFGLALVQRIKPGRDRRPRALVLVPTRELASQVAKELAPLAQARKLRIVALYGGTSYGSQLKALRGSPAIVVATPGRLEDLIARGDVMLDDVSFAVVDEADRMADMGFLPAVRRLLDAARPDRQTLLFSATLDGDVDVLVRRYQSKPSRHEIADESSGADVEHLFWPVERDRRVHLTARLVERHGSAMVFCRTRHGADRLTKQLTAAGIGAVAIHGDRSQAQRERALAAFRSGSVQALVATDVAARGIHVDGVPCVVHFDPAADHKDYLHRSGRTGRAGASGTVVTLLGNEHRAAVKGLQRGLGLPERLDAPDDDGRAVSATQRQPQRPAQRPSEHRRNAPARPAGAANRKRRSRPPGHRSHSN
jgi:superfamily II DNA/RNA helicase